MKKVILLMAVVLSSLTMWARTADEIINELRDEKHAQYITIGPTLLQLARGASSDIPSMAENITSVDVLNVEKCSGGVRKKFASRVDDMRKDARYEEAVSSTRDDERVYVLFASHGNIISEIVIATVGNDYALVQIKGDMTREQLEEIMQKHGAKAASIIGG